MSDELQCYSYIKLANYVQCVDWFLLDCQIINSNKHTTMKSTYTYRNTEIKLRAHHTPRYISLCLVNDNTKLSQRTFVSSGQNYTWNTY